MIDNLRKTFTSPDVAVVFVFSQCDTEKDQTLVSNSILQSILAQLIYQKRSLSYASAQVHEYEYHDKRQASPKAYHNAIRAEINRFSKVFLVVDGLDLFPDRERILHRLQKLPDHAQLFITLREAEIQDHAGYLNILASPEDLHNYVSSRVQQGSNLSRILPDNVAGCHFSDEVARFVVIKSHGQ